MCLEKSIWLKYWFLPNSPGFIRDRSYVAHPQELGAVFPGSLLNCFSHDKSINVLQEEELHCQWSYTLACSLFIYATQADVPHLFEPHV